MRYNRNQPRQRVSWDVALEATAAVFKTFIDKYGPDSGGLFMHQGNVSRKNIMLSINLSKVLSAVIILILTQDCV
jgi:hypothetical protein